MNLAAALATWRVTPEAGRRVIGFGSSHTGFTWHSVTEMTP